MPPKRGAQPQRPASTPPPNVVEPEELSPNLTYLRTHSKWAAVCQYLITFMPAIGVPDYTVQTLEDDLVDSTFMVLPKLMHKMLYTLTLDRRINTDTWQIYLRKQHVKRNPETNPLGTEDEPIEWVSLPIESKLDVMHQVTEWPFGNPTRVRSLMNDDDNYANWRAEPIGLDSKRNAYWFIGGERLWIQRAKAPPPRPKRPVPKKKTGRKAAAAAAEAATATSKRRSRPAKPSPPPSPEPEPDTRRRSKRAAPAESSSSPSKRSKVVGTRVSTRLRGRGEEVEDDEWQPIPEEWLEPASGGSSAVPPESRARPKRGDGVANGVKNKRKSAGLKDDETDDSELTELSDAEVGRPGADKPSDEVKEGDGDLDVDEAEPEPEPETKSEELPSQETSWPLPTDDPNFVEWETICITLDEWNQFAEKFKGSTSMYEKALYRRLTQDFIPWVADIWKERDRALRQVEVVVGRKRSSRLAVIQNEKQKVEAEAEALAKVEAESKRDRGQRMEHRERLQAEERERREREREDRKREREREEEEEEEARLKAEAEAEAAARAALHPPPAQNGAQHTNGTSSRRVKRTKTAPSAATNGTTTTTEYWELACELCGKKGWNVDDGKVITACEQCGKWQHTECHDQADERIGRPKRDWDSVEFVCKACQRRQTRARVASAKADAVPKASSSKTMETHPHAPQQVPQPHYAPNGNPQYSQYNYLNGYYPTPSAHPVQPTHAAKVAVNPSHGHAPPLNTKPYVYTPQYPPQQYPTYAAPQQQTHAAPSSMPYQNGHQNGFQQSAPANSGAVSTSSSGYGVQPMVNGTPSTYSPYQSTQNGRPYINSAYAAPQALNGVQHTAQQQRLWPGQAYGYGNPIPMGQAAPAPVSMMTTYAQYTSPGMVNGTQLNGRSAQQQQPQQPVYQQNSPYAAAQMLAYQAHHSPVGVTPNGPPSNLPPAPPVSSAGYVPYSTPAV